MNNLQSAVSTLRMLYDKTADFTPPYPVAEWGGLRRLGFEKKNINNLPLLSIVTIVLNNAAGLEKTIKSVLEQDYYNIEFIIIDGGSADNTGAMIKNYEKYIDIWTSGRDLGISDAFNRGKSLCSGKYHCMLNADDVFYSRQTISSIAHLMNADYDLICFACELDYSAVRKKIIYPEKFKLRYKMPSSHQAMLFNTGRCCGFFYSLQNDYTMDYEFLCQAVRPEKILYQRVILAVMTMSGRTGTKMLETGISYLKVNFQKKNFFSVVLSIIALIKSIFFRYGK
ncbi:MAG: hypothetical protein A2096_15030 [Spirochaetes bacterium GWF1_41_5]|nr:MAG: hypothetical protein A2096_15030 [Spirochaetes bacterium GWF1_41_5]HBE01810.1 hypothetical protein [Spirochaetia bacterium]